MSTETPSFASSPPSPSTPPLLNSPVLRASFGEFSLSLSFNFGTAAQPGTTNANGPGVGSNNGNGRNSSARSSARNIHLVDNGGEEATGVVRGRSSVASSDNNNKPLSPPSVRQRQLLLDVDNPHQQERDDANGLLDDEAEGDDELVAAAVAAVRDAFEPIIRRNTPYKTFFYSPTTASFASSASSSLHELGLSLTSESNLNFGMAIAGRPFTGGGGSAADEARRAAALGSHYSPTSPGFPRLGAGAAGVPPMSRRPATASPLASPTSSRFWLGGMSSRNDASSINSSIEGGYGGASSLDVPLSRSRGGLATSHSNHHHQQNQWPLQARRARMRARTGGGHNKALAIMAAGGSRGGAGPATSHPPLTQAELDEFEALPVAIRRKYFSTLERLRFAQTSGMLGAAAAHHNHLDDAESHNISKRRRPHPSRQPPDSLADRLRRRSLLGSQFPSNDSVWLDNLPDKIREKHLSPQEQLNLARRLKDSVILDAADEAIYKIGRLAGRNQTPDDLLSVTESSARSSMDSQKSNEMQPPPHMDQPSQDVPESFYESFRWMDEEEDLDLRLFLDDYRSNIHEHAPSPSTKARRPSFRRHMSISKMPFNRPSVSSSRPATKDAAVASPISPALSTMSNGPGHTRRKSRALSLITSKHGAQGSISSIDQSAAHYQDPEARLKLRVYLASPQKFDEAIEFGFPSTDGLSPGTNSDLRSPILPEVRREPLNESDRLRTFLSDDRSSIYSDDASAADPDSPKTPHTLEKPPVRNQRSVTEPVVAHGVVVPKVSTDGYVHGSASCREMTLRMTLTRPDLRAREDQIYGWQHRGPYLGRKSQQTTRDESVAATYIGEGMPKQSIEQVLAGLDHWAPENDGPMKRFWNRVRRGN